jgi:hypothetical protein
MAIGTLVIYAKTGCPSLSSAQHPLLKFAPIASAFVILCVGLLMTAASSAGSSLPRRIRADLVRAGLQPRSV